MTAEDARYQASLRRAEAEREQTLRTSAMRASDALAASGGPRSVCTVCRFGVISVLLPPSLDGWGRMIVTPLPAFASLDPPPSRIHLGVSYLLCGADPNSLECLLPGRYCAFVCRMATWSKVRAHPLRTANLTACVFPRLSLMGRLQ